MHKRSDNEKPRDLNLLAASIVEVATGGELESPHIPAESIDGKNPAAVALGRLGGKIGGKACAEKLTPERRKEIAQKAARAR